MPKFALRYDLTERTVQEVEIEADNLDEAKRLVEEYEFDNSEGREVTSLEWLIDNVREPGDDRPLPSFERTVMGRCPYCGAGSDQPLATDADLVSHMYEQLTKDDD